MEIPVAEPGGLTGIPDGAAPRLSHGDASPGGTRPRIKCALHQDLAQVRQQNISDIKIAGRKSSQKPHRSINRHAGRASRKVRQSQHSCAADTGGLAPMSCGEAQI